MHRLHARDDAMHIWANEPPPVDPAVLTATLVAEYEAADTSRAMAERRYAHAQSRLAAHLATTGPHVTSEGCKYVGLAPVAGLAGAVVRTPGGAGYEPPAVAASHACTDHVVLREDDGEAG